MALNDPQSVTLASGAVSVPRTSSGVNSSTYTSADGTVQLVVSHQYGKRTRRSVRVNVNKITTDPLLTGASINVGLSAYVVLDVPSAGFSADEMKGALLALATWLSSSTGANALKLVGGEN